MSPNLKLVAIARTFILLAIDTFPASPTIDAPRLSRDAGMGVSLTRVGFMSIAPPFVRPHNKVDAGNTDKLDFLNLNPRPRSSKIITPRKRMVMNCELANFYSTDAAITTTIEND